MPSRAKRRSSDPRLALRQFNQEHPELKLHKRNQTDLTRFLVYWAVEIHGGVAVFGSLLKDLFAALDLNGPTDPENLLSRLKSHDQLIKIDVGYRPSAHLKEAMKKELDDRPPLLKVEPHIQVLLNEVVRVDAKNFLEEADLCLRANAPRAAMVMTWIVVIDHFVRICLGAQTVRFQY